MAQASPAQNTIYSLQIQDNLWFNFAPITAQTRNLYNFAHWHQGTKRIADGAGFYSFFTAIKHYFTSAEHSPDVNLYAFLATHKKYEGGDPLKFTLEMSWTVTIDAEHHFSNHMGAQKFEVDTPHPRISVMGHSFCSSMTKMLHEDVKLMLFAPQPIMRYIIWNALEEKGLEDGMSIVWWDGQFSDSRKTTTIEATVSLFETGMRKTEESGGKISGRNKALKKFYQILLKQWQDDSEFHAYEFADKGLTLRCKDGTEVVFEEGKLLPNWFKENSENNGGIENARTILNIDKLALLWEGFNPDMLEITEIKDDVDVAIAGEGSAPIAD